MIGNPFRLSSKSFLGIDIGVSSIKIIELARWGGRVELKNYGYLSISPFREEPFQKLSEDTFLLSTSQIVKVIKSILITADIKTREAVFTIPDFSTFFTSFELPPMSQEELQEAVTFEARQHIPVPISEVVLDWFLIEGKAGKKETNLRVLLVAVPNDLIGRYQEIAKQTGINIKYLEAEAFSLTRALSKEEKGVICVLDIGAQSTTINIIDGGALKLSHSFDVSGNDLTSALIKSLNTTPENADSLKNKYGLESLETKEVLSPLVNIIIMEIEKIFKDFYLAKGSEVKKIILSGGSAFLPGLVGYLSSYFKKEVLIANPFLNIFCPPVLEKKLEKMGPSFTIATGAALRGIKQ
ncbi:MAG: type IV pilus assembly protein PilM [Candidatus Nealsonbacteria bacterium]|nr:type IV pilus assembly protein PilM [Candidatus Nealsonbacteria bacterium]